MKLGLTLACLMVFVVCPISAREKTDAMIMKNGDRITCEVKQLRSNTLYVSIPYILGTVAVDWSRVDHIESNQLFIVKTQDGRVYTGALSTSKTSVERPVQIDILEGAETKVAVDRKTVVEMNQTAHTFWQRLNGQVGTGFTYSKGNESAQYNLNSDVTYQRERWSAGLTYTSNLTSDARSSISTRNEVTLVAQRFLRGNNWYYGGVADYSQSSVQGIQLQSTYGAVIGRNIKNTGSTLFAVYGGLGWQQIDYQEATLPTRTERVTSALVGTNLRVFQFDRTTLTLRAYLLPALSQAGRVHVNVNSSYYVKLWGKLNWNVTFYGAWDNRPPPGFASSDYGTTTGVSITFGNR